MLDLLFDMETQDPDDVLTLCLVACHPAVRLRGVTLTPGSPAQVGLVRRVLRLLDRDDVPVGAEDPGTGKDHVSAFHHRWLGTPPPSQPDASPPDLIARTLERHPDAALLTGAPLRNLGRLLDERPEARLSRWVAQGGFAGDNVVPPEHRLPKFEGRDACPTFNFNGEPRAARRALSSGERIGRRDLVSKNVTHGVRYDREFHERLRPYRDRTAGLGLIFSGMERYLRKRPAGKLLHDPTAACVAVDRTVASWAEVEVVREESGAWGVRPAPGSRTFITVALDHERLFEIFVGEGV
ncbi:pyrimidine-specific ribonucleoside hydrolase [Streptosporangium becharense]|uniref:Pyrimidine-specific ribonucleoside hydrolase n=1 Tax=Streptosporangium becharense TaxID=1816182 RepID=A0A7W9MIB8_9ACTN|nr:nucleoside hydrolase [Streptosporangium becharense]MBB2911127.1 pyrimidine-specific ribonucleoside hydrolase [Streptosporangium becharense]MBB5821815.1 pyrimidine-specific ribonucleoside hydrolase [Streptosporangium becharense]